MPNIKEEKKIIDDLIAGINPVTGETLSAHSVVRERVVVETLTDLSRILESVILNEKRTPTTKVKKKKFYVDESSLSKFSYSDEPITSAEICKRLKRLVDSKETKGIEYGFFRRWLVFMGLLEPPQEGVRRYAGGPSEKGKALGIFTEKVATRFGEKEVILFPIQAQKEIIENLSSLYTFAKLSALQKRENNS